MKPQECYRFIPYHGNMMGLAQDENHIVFKWNVDDCKILFSVTRMGRAASCHFASDKNGTKKIKQAINEFVDFVSSIFEWCELVVAFVTVKSVGRLIQKCGFVKKAYNVNNDLVIYERALQ